MSKILKSRMCIIKICSSSDHFEEPSLQLFVHLGEGRIDVINHIINILNSAQTLIFHALFQFFPA